MRIENTLRPAAIVFTTAVAVVCGSWHDLAAGNRASTTINALSVSPRSAPTSVNGSPQFTSADRIRDGQEVPAPNAGLRAEHSVGSMHVSSPARPPVIDVATIERLRSEPSPEAALLSPVRLDMPMPVLILPPAPSGSVAPPPTPRVGMFARVKPTLVADNHMKPSAIIGAFGGSLDALSTPSTKTRKDVVSGTSFGTNVVYAAPHSDSRRIVESAAFANTAFGSAKVAVSGGEPSYKPPVVVSEQQARYTADAQQARVQGEVTLKVCFLASGQVEVIGIVSGLGYGLDEEARHVAESIHFKPALQNGQPVDQTTLIHVTFQLA